MIKDKLDFLEETNLVWDLTNIYEYMESLKEKPGQARLDQKRI